MLARILTNRLLEGPPKSTAPLIDDCWPSFIRTGPHGPYRFHVNARQGPAPTVIAVHGWTSGAAHARNRTQVLADAGFNVVLLESLGHGTSTYNAEWTAHCILDCLEDLLDGVFDGSVDLLATDVLLHGHSLGAYVVLRSLRGRHGDRVRALLLESPMTCYSPILDEALANVSWVRWIPGFRKRLERALMARWNRLHPEVTINDISDVDVPRWSKPDLPTFVMQADPDRRLGPVHLDALLSCVDSGHLDVWKSSTLRHSGTSEHALRDEAMMAWLASKDFIPRC